MSTWEDRRAMFQTGKIVHEPGQPIKPRRASTNEKLTQTLSNTSTSSQGAGVAGSPVSAAAGSGMPSPSTERRRSSASSGGGLFANLTSHKRGSQDYGTRRASVEEMEAKSGAYSGWYNSTFRGMQKVKEEVVGEKKRDERRGVME